jgi:hypothetical protein
MAMVCKRRYIATGSCVSQGQKSTPLRTLACVDSKAGPCPKADPHNTARWRGVGSRGSLTLSDVAKLQIRLSYGVNGVSARSLQPRL